jgi:phosphoribosylaminoimidazolecarboxamide formyltransferase/IMP cyclohydrolase
MQKHKALISVYDKNDIELIAACLMNHNIELLATGGSLKYLQEKNIPVTDVADYTLFPEMLNGRVKTLHPKLFGGILFKRNDQIHNTTIDNNNIIAIDFVIVNLYPFVKKQQENLTHDELIEFIDIGGPSLLRAAAKNYYDVTVITDIKDYAGVIQEMNEQEQTTIETRRKLAAKVFNITSAYDASVANFLNEEIFPQYYNNTYELKEILRYGENPHQQAAIYADLTQHNNVNQWNQLQGKELSYNNYRDIQAAINIVKEFNEPVCCAVKHNTPCGVAIGKDALDAYQKAYLADPVSIFGGIIAFNVILNEATATLLNDTFLEVIIAPDFTKASLGILAKKKNVRVLKISMHPIENKQIVSINGGLLVQTSDPVVDYEINVVTKKKPSEYQINQLVFAQKIVKHCTSNAIVLCKDYVTVGIGSGQTNRIRSAEQAILQAKEKKVELSECVMSSDAFFPFNDIVKLCATNQISAIIQPGGSIKDQDSIDSCNEHGIAMLFTGVRHFKH